MRLVSDLCYTFFNRHDLDRRSYDPMHTRTAPQHIARNPVMRFLSLDHVIFPPVERRQAPIVQIVLVIILLISLLSLAMTLADPRPVPLILEGLALAAGGSMVIGAGVGLLSLRHGRFAHAVWSGAVGVTLGMLLFIIATGLIETSEFALGLLLPLMFAGLLLRRTHLWIFLALSVGGITAMFLCETPLAAITGVPITDPTKSAYERLFWPISLLAIYAGMGGVLDRFSSTLRTALLVSLQRERELTDIRDHLEILVAERTHDLREALDLNQRLMATRTEAVRSAVHDLRHAATRVQATIDVWHLDLTSSLADPQALQQRLGEGYQQFRLALAEQTDLMDEMRDATMLEAGTLVLTPETVDLVDLVATVVARFQPRFDLADCELDMVAADNLAPARVDRRRMRRVVANILENALRYTVSVRDDGHVQVAIRGEADGMLAVSITDNGRGIEPEQIARLGQTFTRLRQGATEPDGMGLGLHFCMGILALSGGTLTLDSSGEGCGTTVTIWVLSDATNARHEKED